MSGGISGSGGIDKIIDDIIIDERLLGEVMRMWMVDPRKMCSRHLLGEHGELHKHLHNWRKKHSIDGRITGNAIEPESYKERHEELAKEMISRGMRHESPLEQPDFGYLEERQRSYKVDRVESYKMLIERCSGCKERSVDEV